MPVGSSYDLGGDRKRASEGYEGSSEGSWEEFTARSDRGFEAIGPAEAEGNGDVWCMCGYSHSGGSCWYGRDREFSR